MLTTYIRYNLIDALLHQWSNPIMKLNRKLLNILTICFTLFASLNICSSMNDPLKSRKIDIKIYHLDEGSVYIRKGLLFSPNQAIVELFDNEVPYAAIYKASDPIKITHFGKSIATLDGSTIQIYTCILDEEITEFVPPKEMDYLEILLCLSPSDLMKPTWH